MNNHGFTLEEINGWKELEERLRIAGGSIISAVDRKLIVRVVEQLSDQLTQAHNRENTLENKVNDMEIALKEAARAV